MLYSLYRFRKAVAFHFLAGNSPDYSGNYTTEQRKCGMIKKSRGLFSVRISAQKGEPMKNKELFIMLPTVDFCFQKLMDNPKVRKGFVAALMKVSPKLIRETKLLPTLLPRESENDKLGILDVRVMLVDGTQLDLEMQVRYFEYWDERAMFYLSKMFVSQMKKGEDYENLKKCIHVSILDFIHFPEDDTCYRTIHLRDDETGKLYSDKLEIQILELKKLPKEVKTGDDIITWMKFFSGKNREEFNRMRGENEYIDEACNELFKLSADDKKRLEYEQREKAIRDYHSQLNSARRQGERECIEIGEKRGIEIGEKRGEKRGIAIGEERYNRLILKLTESGEIELLKKAAGDEEFRKELYKKYNVE